MREDVIAVPGEAVVVKDGKYSLRYRGDKAVEREVQLGLDIGRRWKLLKGLKKTKWLS